MKRSEAVFLSFKWRLQLTLSVAGKHPPVTHKHLFPICSYLANAFLWTWIPPPLLFTVQTQSMLKRFPRILLPVAARRSALLSFARLYFPDSCRDCINPPERRLLAFLVFYAGTCGYFTATLPEVVPGNWCGSGPGLGSGCVPPRVRLYRRNHRRSRSGI